jgi:hypothetical protein
LQHIELLIIGGHGNQVCTDFGSSCEIRRERLSLDLSDFQEMGNLSQYLSDDSVVILVSCSTGEGGQCAENMANMLSRVFPYSWIVAPNDDSDSFEYSFDPMDGRVSGVRFLCDGRDCTYETFASSIVP